MQVTYIGRKLRNISCIPNGIPRKLQRKYEFKNGETKEIPDADAVILLELDLETVKESDLSREDRELLINRSPLIKHIGGGRYTKHRNYLKADDAKPAVVVEAPAEATAEVKRGPGRPKKAE